MNVSHIRRCISGNWKCPWENQVCNIGMKTEKTLWILNQGQNTNTTITITFTCYLCWNMLLHNDLWCNEVFGLMEPCYLYCHIMLSSSEGSYIRIGLFSATSKGIYDRPLESCLEFDHQNDNNRMDWSKWIMIVVKLKAVCLLQKEVTQLS